MILPISYYGSPVLREKSKKVAAFDSALRELAKNMVETMRKNGAPCLAAPQVGASLAMCIVNPDTKGPEFTYCLDSQVPPLGQIMPLILVNPALKLNERKTEVDCESCLSFPLIFADIERSLEIECVYQDIEGKQHTLTCSGALSRLIQHVADHLNGILFIDRMSKNERAKVQCEIEKIRSARGASKP